MFERVRESVDHVGKIGSRAGCMRGVPFSHRCGAAVSSGVTYCRCRLERSCGFAG